MEWLYRFICCSKYKEYELQEYLINNSEKIMVNCYYIKPNNSEQTIDKFRAKIGRNIPKFLPIELLDYSLEYLICIDALFDIKSLCDELDFTYKFMRTIEITKDQYNSVHIIIYDTINKEFKLKNIMN